VLSFCAALIGFVRELDRRPGRGLMVAALLGAVVFATSGCSVEKDAAGPSFEPATPGTLTVATAFLPAPGFWQGVVHRDGFEAHLAAVLAERLGLDRVHVVHVPFAAIVRGDLGGADVALSQLTPTRERERQLDFTTPYLIDSPGILARRGVEAADAKTLRGLRWVVSRASTLTPIVMDAVRPSAAPLVVVDRTQALRVLRRGRADALLLDLPVALGLARAEAARFHVIGQIGDGEGLAVALPAGSRNAEIVDSEVRALAADRTIARLESRWLGNTDDVPLILTEG
jgi:polar amino acid transport system substrate-binding protein